MNAPDLPAGTLVGGDYRVVSTLARGGMGVVYVAEQESTRKRRALKVMLPQGGDLDSLRKRFEQEAYVSGQIESDHVVEVIGAGVDAATTMPWIAMELLEGEDLESRLGAGPLEWADTWNVVGELSHALEAAHKLGLIHRDLKPSNVFLAKSRRPGVERTVKILDFGIAKQMSDAGKTTGALGTPLYMSPEQTTSGSSFTPATDVWALGLLVFEMLVGVPYWKSASQEGQIAALLREVVLDPIAPASARATHFGKAFRLPPRFDAWFARCVVRDPGKRFGDAGEAYRALAKLFAEVTGLNERVIPPPSARLPRPIDSPPGKSSAPSLSREAHQARTQPAFERNTSPVAPLSRAGVLIAGVAAGVAVVVVALAVFVIGGVVEKGPVPAGSGASERELTPEPIASASARPAGPAIRPAVPAAPPSAEVGAPVASSSSRPVGVHSASAQPPGRAPAGTAPPAPSPDAPTPRPPRAPPPDSPPKPGPAPVDPVIL